MYHNETVSTAADQDTLCVQGTHPNATISLSTTSANDGFSS